MESGAIEAIQHLQHRAASLLIYQSVLMAPPGQAFLNLLSALLQEAHRSDHADITPCLKAYGQWFYTLAERDQSWQDYLLAQIAISENPFSDRVQSSSLNTLPVALLEATRQDLQSIQVLYNCNTHHISQWVQQTNPLDAAPIVWQIDRNPEAVLPPLDTVADWGQALETLATYYRQHGTGLFAQYRALRWQSGYLQGIPYPDPIQLQQLAGYESQRNSLLKNTEFLLAGYPALHVLLYGSRGSGKSSLIKALLSEYGDRGLRLIEIAKADLQDLPIIVEQLRHAPQKFILFVDDLSFEEDEDAYKSLKVILEGNLTSRPQNVVVYATSNRRHLIREFWGDRPQPRDAEEVHSWDTVQEKLSFSDRFGLTLTFEPSDQTTYLTIVRHLAQQDKINLEPDYLEYLALQWATRHNGRSGRTARQFINFLKADLAVYGSEAYQPHSD